MPEKKEDWYNQLPEFWEENLWRKVPLTEEGLCDFTGYVENGYFEPQHETFGSLPPEEKLGISQEYRKIGEEDFFCVAITFFDYDEPSLIFWSKKSAAAPFLGFAVKQDKIWWIIRPPEALKILLGISSKNPDQTREVTLLIHNLITNAVILNLTFQRKAED